MLPLLLLPVPVSIFPHSGFDSLMSGLSGFWGERRGSPSPAPVVIPSIPISDYLQLRIAQQCGVCMGYDFLTAQALISRAMGRRDEAWIKEHLCWRILPHIAAHASDLGVQNPSSRDQFALAGLLADRFDQYGHYRPEILRRWAEGKSALRGNASADEKRSEAWQRELWLTLRAETAAVHPALEIGILKENADFLARLRSAFPRLLVIGTGAIDPLLVEFLGVLSDAGGNVTIHAVLPSLDYLGDLRRRSVLPVADADPESILLPSGHPMLESMGRQAVGTFLLLGKLDDQYTHWPEPGEQPETRGSLLERLQADVRALRDPVSEEPNSNDISLRVHSCFGSRREMEVLRDEILRAFRDLPDLQPDEVHVVTPSLETYAPLVAAVLEESGLRLPVRMTELPPGAGDPVILGVQALLEMARGGRFEASWIMELLHLRAVQEALGIFDDDKGLDRLRGWIEQSGLTQGLADDGPGTWTFARDRLIAARWFGAEDSIKYPDGSFVLPVADQLDGDGELRERFVSWHAALALALREWTVKASPVEWAARLDRACEVIFGGTDDNRLAIRPHIAFLQDLQCSELTDAGAILDWLLAASADTGRRAKVSGCITLGRFKQLQNMPCRVLAMVGMHDRAFPGQNRVPAWDLLQSDPRVWDRNARLDDRQLFLDAVLAPQDRLIITASTRNVRTKKNEPFSSCVDELLRVAESMGGRSSDLVIQHRLQPFEEGYFLEPSDLPHSFDKNHAEVARSLRQRNPADGIPFWNGADVSLVTPDEERPISLPELIAFWKDPAKAFLRAQGIALHRGEEADDEDLDRAPLALDGLQDWKVKDSIIEELVFGSSDLARTEATLRANRALPPGGLGTRAWQENVNASQPLGEGVRAHLGGRLAVECALNDFNIRVTGHILTGKPGEVLFAYRTGEMATARHFLEAWIQAVLAACCGLSWRTALLDEVNPDQVLVRPAIPADHALEILDRLVQGFLIGQRRPLCFGLATSSELLKQRIKLDHLPSALAVAAAREWHPRLHGNPEGCSPSAQTAWRDRDPFEDPESWLRWAEAIARPLNEWGDCP